MLGKTILIGHQLGKTLPHQSVENGQIIFSYVTVIRSFHPPTHKKRVEIIPSYVPRNIANYQDLVGIHIPTSDTVLWFFSVPHPSYFPDLYRLLIRISSLFMIIVPFDLIHVI